MSKTLNQLTYSILEAVTNFSYNDDTPIPSLWVEDQIITQHATLVRKALSEKKIDQGLYVIHEQLEVKTLDKSFNVGNIKIGNKTDFCYADINPLMTGLKGKEIDFVSDISYSTIYVRKALRTLLQGASGYYSFPKPSYAMSRNKIILRISDLGGAAYISINGIWADPRLASGYNKDEKFPTPSERSLEQLTIQHIQYALQNQPDLINDAQRAYQQPAAKPIEE